MMKTKTSLQIKLLCFKYEAWTWLEPFASQEFVQVRDYRYWIKVGIFAKDLNIRILGFLIIY